jgi:hypothetical protein
MADISYLLPDSRRGTYFLESHSSTDKLLDTNPEINPHTPARLGSGLKIYGVQEWRVSMRCPRGIEDAT